MSKIKDSWDKIKIDEQVKEEILKQIMAGAKNTKSRKRLRLITALAACLLLVFSSVIAYKNLSPSQKPNIDPDSLSDEIKGLAVDNFKLSDVYAGISMDRDLIKNLVDFFAKSMGTDYIFIVKVAYTQSLKPKYSHEEGRQLSEVKILQNIYGSNEPDIIQIQQTIYGEGTEPDLTKQALLREGGVYLLPLLMYYDEELDSDIYYIQGVYDVLFEIDEEGLVYSHSDFPDLSVFDGKDYKLLVEEIEKITQDEALMLRYSDMGKMMQNHQLAEVEILSNTLQKTLKNDYGDGTEYSSEMVFYEARLIKNLGKEAIADDLTLWFYKDESIPLERNKPYIMFVSLFDEGYMVNNNSLAIVEADEYIKTIKFDSVYKHPFEKYDGLPLNDLIGAAEHINQYMNDG